MKWVSLYECRPYTIIGEIVRHIPTGEVIKVPWAEYKDNSITIGLSSWAKDSNGMAVTKPIKELEWLDESEESEEEPRERHGLHTRKCIQCGSYAVTDGFNKCPSCMGY